MKHNVKVLTSSEVYKQILWFTHNYPKEIGAVGTGGLRTDEDGKYFYIDKLYFPKQYVTGASVHFTAEMWGDIIKKLPIKELGRICFYWHKHPGGNASHSSTDEEDTFETFMDPIAKRKFFIFAQTASKSGGGVDSEWRIDITNPVRATFLHKDIDWLYEEDAAEIKLKKECETIIAESVVERPKAAVPVSSRAPLSGYYPDGENWKQSKKDWKYWEHIGEMSALSTQKENRYYFDNDFLNGMATALTEKASIEFKNGAVYVKAGPQFQKVIDSALLDDGALTTLTIHNRIAEPVDASGLKQYMLQPKTAGYDKLCGEVKRLFNSYNAMLVRMWSDAVTTKNDGELMVNPASTETRIKQAKGETYELVDRAEDFFQFLGQLELAGVVEWENDDKYANVWDEFKMIHMGSITCHTKDGNDVTFDGEELVDLCKEILGEEVTIKDMITESDQRALEDLFTDRSPAKQKKGG